MIEIELPARMLCVHDGCTAFLSVKLALSAGGTLVPGFDKGHGWQVMNQGGTFVCRCPQHHAPEARIHTPGPDKTIGASIARLNGKH